MKKVKDVLIATDLSKHSEAVMSYSARELLDSEKITLLNVVPCWPVESLSETVQAKWLEEALKTLRKQSEKYFPGKEVEVKGIISLQAAQEITDFARENKSDLIIVGSKGAGAVSNLFIGSTMQKVTKLSPCPVIVIPEAILNKEILEDSDDYGF